MFFSLAYETLSKQISCYQGTWGFIKSTRHKNELQHRVTKTYHDQRCGGTAPLTFPSELYFFFFRNLFNQRTL